MVNGFCLSVKTHICHCNLLLLVINEQTFKKQGLNYKLSAFTLSNSTLFIATKPLKVPQNISHVSFHHILSLNLWVPKWILNTEGFQLISNLRSVWTHLAFSVFIYNTATLSSEKLMNSYLSLSILLSLSYCTQSIMNTLLFYLNR